MRLLGGLAKGGARKREGWGGIERRQKGVCWKGKRGGVSVAWGGLKSGKIVNRNPAYMDEERGVSRPWEQ